MRGNSAPLLLFSSILAALLLAGCVSSPVHLDPLSVDGRDGGGPTPTYPMLMRIGTAAQSGGDLPNAVSVYRRAAEMAPQNPAPLIAAGDVLLKWNDAAINTPGELRQLVEKTTIGSKAKVIVRRNGQELPLEVIVGRRPPNLPIES